MPGHDPQHREETLSRPKLQRPRKFRVLMHNDDYTTMEFVVQMLVLVFQKEPLEAFQIMLNIHHQGVGFCGVYPFQIAESKVQTVHEAAKKAGFPLRCSVEPEEESDS